MLQSRALATTRNAPLERRKSERAGANQFRRRPRRSSPSSYLQNCPRRMPHDGKEGGRLLAPRAGQAGRQAASCFCCGLPFWREISRQWTGQWKREREGREGGGNGSRAAVTKGFWQKPTPIRLSERRLHWSRRICNMQKNGPSWMKSQCAKVKASCTGMEP